MLTTLKWSAFKRSFWSRTLSFEKKGNGRWPSAQTINSFSQRRNFEWFKTHLAIWRLSFSSPRWTQINQVAINHKWWGYLQDCRSYWSNTLDSDSTLVCTKMSVSLNGRSKCTTQRRLNWDRLSNPNHLSFFRRALDEKLKLRSTNSIIEH